MKKFILLTFLTLSLLLCVACNQQATRGVESSVTAQDVVDNIKVTANNVNVKSGCSNNTATLASYNKDTIFNVVSKVADWYAVKLPNNDIGFIPQSQAKPIVVDNTAKSPAGTTPGTKTGTNTAPVPNTRTGTDITPLPDNNVGTNPGTTPGITTGTPTGAPTGAPTGTPTPTPTGTDNQSNANTSSLTANEQQMLKLINQVRAQNNSPALQADLELTKVARIKSQDMIDKNYFSHNSPTYGSPFDMMKKFGIKYVKAGENIAGNQSVAAAHEAFMNSPGHRKNILNPDYTHVGLGIKSGGQYGLMFCQMFISKPQ